MPARSKDRAPKKTAGKKPGKVRSKKKDAGRIPEGTEEEASLIHEPIAVQLAKDQREISISEFFIKNRHLLGFDNPKKALLTAVKEAVDPKEILARGRYIPPRDCPDEGA